VTLFHQVVPDSEGSAPPSDAELILAVRAGDRRAYGVLYERHLGAARAHARRLTRSSADADDLVAETFAKIFSILRAGRGPDSAFRAYLMTALRNGYCQRMREDRRLEFTDDMTRHDDGVPWADPVEAELNSSLAARAFSTLPERWQAVLWQSEVEGKTAAEIGERLDLRPNAVAALAYRAREGLRQAYLRAHLTEYPDEDCRPTVHRLGGWTRGKLAPRDTAVVREHLDDCDRCRSLAAELVDVNDSIRGLLAPLAVVGTTAGYASATAGAVPVGVAASGPAVGATVASGSAAGAAGGGSLIGSAAGWVLGAHAGQAAAVLTAVLVGGTAVAAGTAAVDTHRRGRTPAVAAVAGSGRTIPVGAHPEPIDLRQTVPVTKGKPPSGKQPNGKSLVARSDKQPSGKQPKGKSLVAKGDKQPSGKSPNATGPTAKSSGKTPSGKTAYPPAAKKSPKASASPPRDKSAKSSKDKAATLKTHVKPVKARPAPQRPKSSVGSPGK
jgi:RNA polymerase sigma factor (sigma-70 family)